VAPIASLTPSRSEIGEHAHRRVALRDQRERRIGHHAGVDLAALDAAIAVAALPIAVMLTESAALCRCSRYVTSICDDEPAW
jgi:hypothetical protein